MQEIENNLLNLNHILFKYDKLKDFENLFQNQKYEIEKQIKQCEKEVLLAEASKTFYQNAIDLIYERSIGELKQLLNNALSFVFFDKQYEVDIILSDKRGKSLTFLFVDKTNKNQIITDLKTGVGAGIRTVVSFIIHVFYLINNGSNILFLDEAYNYVSEEYRDNFFLFMKNLAKEKGLIVVMISHLDFVNDYADKIYRVTDGVIKLEKEENDG